MRPPGCRHHVAGNAPPVQSVTVDVAIPVFNEERALPGCISVLHGYLDESFPFDWTITIVDNASTDSTPVIAKDIARWCPRVRALCLDRKGKGHAVRTAWSASAADVVAYMDVDLSTGLDALLPLVAPLANGHSDLAIGSRLAAGARTVRGTKRELISRGYNALLRLCHGTRFSDAQCGFKAARAAVIRPLLRHVEDESWFFDTELLLLAEHNRLRVHEVPVDWVEDVDSRVGVVGTATTNLRGMARIALAKASGAARVAGLPARPRPTAAHPDAVLAASEPRTAWRLVSHGVTALPAAATLAVYAVLRFWWPPLVANAVAAGLTTRLASWATASWPPGRQAPAGTRLGRHLLATSGALVLLDAVVGRPTRTLELAALLVPSVAGAAGRHAAPGLIRGLARRRPTAGRWQPVIVQQVAAPAAGAAGAVAALDAPGAPDPRHARPARHPREELSA